jgi:glycosyltransferase involved in cell wall biosynthesis
MLHVIQNGVDSTTFAPDVEARAITRHALGLAATDFVIGLVGRFNPAKDHATFLRATELILKARSNVVFVLAGQDVTVQNQELTGCMTDGTDMSRYRFLGPREDIDNIYRSLDVLCSSSAWEAFPLVLGEAMACGVPCIATDVGDCRSIVGDTGIIVPPRDTPALARAILAFMDMANPDRKELGTRARRRVVERFDVREMAAAYLAYYEELAQRRVA